MQGTIWLRLTNIRDLAEKINTDSGNNLDTRLVTQVLNAVTAQPIPVDGERGYTTLLHTLADCSQGALTPQRLDSILCEDAQIPPFLFDSLKVHQDIYAQFCSNFNRKYLGEDTTQYDTHEKQRMSPALRHYFLSRVLYGEYCSEGRVYADTRSNQVRIVKAITAYTSFHPSENAALFAPVDKEALRRIRFLLEHTQFDKPNGLYHILSRLMPPNELTLAIQPTELEDDFFTPEKRTGFVGVAFDTLVKPAVITRMNKLYQI
ncbi:hypothetical protein HYV86_02170 [Candidatus Woesearchaeota archaeon]|nr:hypothetical protein [Candidatus Woesearchaeota archaeon]